MHSPSKPVRRQSSLDWASEKDNAMNRRTTLALSTTLLCSSILPSAAITVTALSMTATGAEAQDALRYPDWSGQWSRVPDGGEPRYDPSKPLDKQADLLKPEYQVRHQASMKDQEAGGFGLDRNYAC